MSAPIPTTVVIDQARDFYLTTVYQDSTGTPINLTGYTATFAIGNSYNGATVLTLTVGSGITITASTGTITVHATSSQTAITDGSYVAELVITSSAGVATSLLKGAIVVKPKVVA
jgi:hypothetical protein